MANKIKPGKKKPTDVVVAVAAPPPARAEVVALVKAATKVSELSDALSRVIEWIR